MSRVSRWTWLMVVSVVSSLQGYPTSAEVATPSCSSVSPSAGAEREWKIGNAIAFSTRALQVDADGAPDSYRVDGNGLSDTCDGVVAIVNGVRQTPKNNKDHWLELCRERWHKATVSHDYSQVDIFGFLKDKDGPVIQGVGDPLPDAAYITTTSMVIAGTPERVQRHYVNATEIPYVVLSPQFAKKYDMRLGDVVAVYRPKTQRMALGVYADCCSLGEASVRLHEDIGSQPIRADKNGIRRAKRNVPDETVTLVFPGQHTTATTDADKWRADIRSTATRALQSIGGLDRVLACTK